MFFLILLTGYVYVWRKGVFNWGHEAMSAWAAEPRPIDTSCLNSKSLS